MYEITAQGIKDFSVCSLYYDFKHQQSLPYPIKRDAILENKFQETILKVLGFLFFKRQGGDEVSLKALANRWGKIWFPKDITAFDISVAKNPNTQYNLVKYSSLANDIFSFVLRDFSDGVPILINESFVVPLTKSIKITGQFDLIYYMAKDKTFNIIKWVFGYDAKRVDYTYDFAILKYAAQYRGLPLDKTKFFIYQLNAADNNHFIEANSSSSQMESLIYWAELAQETEEHVPRRGKTIYCKDCVYDKECLAWDKWSELNVKKRTAS